MSEFKYKYRGKVYTSEELFDFFEDEWNRKEKKKKWWKRLDFKRYHFSSGFFEGMKYGVKLITDKENNKIK